MLCDLLWSDPDKKTQEWGTNDRGISVTFSEKVLDKFLDDLDLDLIVRAHQVIIYRN